MKADLVMKVYALLMRDVVLRSAENTQQAAENCGENSGHFKYDETMRRISALGWSTDFRQASRTELHSALRLPFGVNTQVPPYFVEGHTLQKVKIIPIFL